MAIARASLLEPIPALSVDVNKSALVIGGGVAGMTAASAWRTRVFRRPSWKNHRNSAGRPRDFTKTWDGQDIRNTFPN